MARQVDVQMNGEQESQPITEAWAASVLPRREPGVHKWAVGGVVVVAGSPQFAGAAALCSAGAARSGAGIVIAAAPRSIASVVVSLVPEVTVTFLPEGDSTSVAKRAVEAINERLQRARAMVVGPGLGDDEATSNLLETLFGLSRSRAGIGFGVPGGDDMHTPGGGVIASSEKPVVVDADALNWLASRGDWWSQLPPERLVLTPHAGEMARLLEQDSSDISENAVAVAHAASVRWSQTVVLKGNPTVVAGPNGVIRTNATPSSLATAGSGDVLSGSIAAFLAQGLAPSDAAALAVFAGSRAATRVEERYGTLGVIASDLPAAIAEELRALEQSGD